MAKYWCVNFEDDTNLELGIEKNLWSMGYQYADDQSDSPARKAAITRNWRKLEAIEPGHTFVAYLLGKGFFAERSAALVRELWDGLGRIPGLRLYGPPPGVPRTPTVSLVVEGRPSVQIARGLAARGVFVSHGDFYATTAVARLGLAPEGLVRVGCACYTTEDEVGRLIDGVKEIVG